MRMEAGTTPLPVADVARLHEIAERHGVRRVRVFGSVARGEGKPESDLDLLIAFDGGRGFRDLMDFCDEVEATLGRRVDVVLEDGLSPYIRDRVLREALAL
jgi:predicted nucleotidyltransferase